MGKVKGLVCLKCQKELAPAERAFACPDCRTVLDVQMDLGSLSADFQEKLLRRQDTTIWKWHEFLPVEDLGAIVSLGEGYTPLIQTPALVQATGLDRLYIKNDTLLPSGSMKDRGNAVGISRAKEWEAPVAAVVSTGNAAASVAAYAAAAGMRAVVLVPAAASPMKLLQAALNGAQVIVVEGDFDQVAALYREAAAELGWFDCTSTNPYRLEGKKSYAFEVWEQLDGEVPDWMVHCAATGSGVVGAAKGFRELKGLGWLSRQPRFVAAQAAACAPIVRAFGADADEVAPMDAGPTMAENLRVGKPSSVATRCLLDVKNSGGAAIAVTDDELRAAQALLARTCGIFGELGGVASFAATLKLKAAGKLDADDLVVCTISSHGLKQPEGLSGAFTAPKPIPATLAALREQVQEPAA